MLPHRTLRISTGKAPWAAERTDRLHRRNSPGQPRQRGYEGPSTRHLRKGTLHASSHSRRRVPGASVMSPVRIRPLGGAMGCLVMIAVSIALSVILTVLLNLGR